jgi:GMP synthase-like glutamine amidotransferase
MIAEHLKDTDKEIKFVRVSTTITSEELLIDGDKYTHLILSGSEASTLDDYGWEEPMKAVVMNFIGARKPVLGICYGHQFLVRILAGKNHLRIAPLPEIGWGNISLQSNPLFAGIKEPVCLLSHYDEAVDLPDDFHILGASKKCGVHAFQYKELPVWGVQFHPEYDTVSGKEIFDELEVSEPRFNDLFFSEMCDAVQLKQNKKFFTNFIGM